MTNMFTAKTSSTVPVLLHYYVVLLYSYILFSASLVCALPPGILSPANHRGASPCKRPLQLARVNMGRLMIQGDQASNEH
jgi:hypothetical protein